MSHEISIFYNEYMHMIIFNVNILGNITLAAFFTESQVSLTIEGKHTWFRLNNTYILIGFLH